MKPKIAILSHRENAAISHILRPVAKALRVDLFYYPFPGLDLSKYDLIHVGWRDLLTRQQYDEAALTSINVWGIATDKIREWQSVVRLFDHYVVDDIVTYQILRQLGAKSVSQIPLAFDASKFEPLPLTARPFTVGVFCNDYRSKRYDVVRQGCKAADVRCFSQVLPARRTHYSIDPVRDVYRHIDVLVHASFSDTNSMPAHEALYCGRPVISTRNDGIRRVLVDGWNGLYFDGSVEDLAKKIRIVQEDYFAYAAAAIQTAKPPLEESIRGYAKVFGDLLGTTIRPDTGVPIL